ncbi:hypothetical protein M405DRAFT_855911 [Rhizopogon salebrosus TDB-379]|nr:hypothetical protein M405DRAFT_855911 [Rhizopogon salebrosus TDB-379]
MYWAIVNDRPEALSAFTGFISKISSGCRSELRRACMETSNHAAFMQLNLGRNIGPDDGPLRHSLGCPSDEIEVHEGEDLGEHQFVALFRFRMCQKRLYAKQNMSAEFVAGRRIWSLRIYMGPHAQWLMEWGLSRHSLPARPRGVVLIEPQREKPGCATKPRVLRMEPRLGNFPFLAPEE